MITKDQAIELREVFTVGLSRVCDEPTGYKVYRWRRNGSTQVWKTRPNDWRLPVKFGLRTYGSFNQDDAASVYATYLEADAVGKAMYERETALIQERRTEREFTAALANQRTWELGDDGTMETVLVCLLGGHREVCADRESAIAVLEGPCERCEWPFASEDARTAIVDRAMRYALDFGCGKIVLTELDAVRLTRFSSTMAESDVILQAIGWRHLLPRIRQLHGYARTECDRRKALGIEYFDVRGNTQDDE